MSQVSIQRRGTAILGALEPRSVGSVRSLLAELPRDYPGAEAWLRRRLDDALHGRAECWTLAESGRVAGVVILTPKASALKLSTIYVADRVRGRGLGSLLMDHVVERASELGFDETYVTVAEHTVPLLRPLLDSRAFTLTALEKHRYGRDRHEAVFSRLAS
ncbi:MAG: GNAT family N-acetyltransferase [Propionibacteriaceae bacterium]|jgi:GNAT superfamily N-acetyltransferase|nr:GNAT family N-acetyltransferase [Propionibacteriaceae bacterium]